MKTEVNILCIYKVLEIVLASPTLYAFKRSSVNCGVFYTHSKHVNIQFAYPPPSSHKHTHSTERHAALRRNRSMVFGKRIRWFACRKHGMPYLKTILKGGGLH